MQRFHPTGYGAEIIGRNHGITQHRMLQALTERIDYETGRTEIHIGHPERHKIVMPKEFLQIVILEASFLLMG